MHYRDRLLEYLFFVHFVYFSNQVNLNLELGLQTYVFLSLIAEVNAASDLVDEASVGSYKFYHRWV